MVDPSVFTIHGNEAVQRYTAARLAAHKERTDGVRQDGADERGVPDQGAP